MGDLNTADAAELTPLLDSGWQRAPLGPSHPSWAPSAAIDHVLVSPDLRVESARVVESVRISDHLPVLVEVGAAA